MTKMNYIQYEYGGDLPTKMILDLEREDPMQKRMNGATPLEGKAEEIHQVVLAKIQDYFPKLKRQCFEKMGIDGLGCLLKDARGVHHPLINQMVARLLRSSQFDYFRTHNIQKGISVTPEDFLANIIAHEYGHIAKDEFLDISMRFSNYGYGLFESLSAQGEKDEAFAFWFGDSISQTKTNIPRVSQRYRYLNPDNLKRIYDDLTSLSVEQGIDYVLSPAVLAKVLENKVTYTIIRKF